MLKYFVGIVLICQAFGVKNVEVKRVIDLTKYVVKVKTDITYKEDSNVLTVYSLAIPEQQYQHLSLIQAKCNKKSCNVVKSTEQTQQGYVMHTVYLKDVNTVPKGEQGTIQLTAFYTHALIPYPTQVTQAEKQYVEYFDSHLWPSLYETTSQTTSVKCPGEILSFAKHEPTEKKGSKVVYGPYQSVQPLASEFGSMKLHLKNHAPFITLTNVVKEIELSMWGRVSVEEVYDLLHSGAVLKGGFSRLDYTMNGKTGASFNQVRAILPKDAENVYYRDIIGNITTSRLRVSKLQQELELQPRFPIFGGWKTQWYMGYSVPTAGVLIRKGNSYSLKMAISTPIEEATVDDLTVKVILPEGATNIKLNVPFKTESQSQTIRHTYLDSAMFGRPVMVIHKKNLVPQHNIPFTVTFDFDSKMMLHEPMLLIAAFMSFFLLCIVGFRLDLSLVKSKTN